MNNDDVIALNLRRDYTGIDFSFKKSININHQGLSTLQPVHINRFTTGITNLSLLGNHFTSIPPLISEKLPNLRKLIMSCNRISTAQFSPSSMSNNLTTLDLSRNQLSTIPPSISNLTNLEALRIYHNKITGGIPPQFIMNLTKLEFIDLSYNMITTIPSAITELKSLVSLNLSTNQISRPPTLDLINHLLLTRRIIEDSTTNSYHSYHFHSGRYVVLFGPLSLFMKNNPFINNYKLGDCLALIFPSLKDITARFVFLHV